MNQPLPKNLRSFIWIFLKPHKKSVIIFISLGILAGLWGPLNSLTIKHIINTLSSNQQETILSLTYPAIFLVLNFIIFDNFTWRIMGYLSYKTQPIIKNQIISHTFRFVVGSSHHFFQDNFSGRISNQITTLADNIERILHKISENFIRGASMLVISLITMYFINIKFFWTLSLWCIAFTLFSMYMSKKLVNLSDTHTASESIVSGQLVDNITNASNIRIFAKSAYEMLRLDKFLLITKVNLQAKELFTLKLYWAQGMLIAIMLGFMIYFLIDLYAKGLITIGDFALIMGLSMEMSHITWYTMSEVDEFNKAVGKCKQSLSFIIKPHEITDKENALDLLVNNGKISFENVKFHYKGAAPLFQNKSITIEAGQKVGLVGYSGSGKSTFANLILRLYDVNDGAVLIDNQNIREVTQASLRNNIAMIPQDPSLFHRTLMENIAYGSENVTENQVIEAAKNAHAHEFIEKLPEKYDSMVGERGVKLSGGQRQRIAIARAFIKNAPILILDEATSQLDSVTEGLIQDSLAKLIQNKTTIVIAHRLSTLLNMDRILVFDEGKIVEDGTHTDLLIENGLYKTLWNAQVGGLLPDKKETI